MKYAFLLLVAGISTLVGCTDRQFVNNPDSTAPKISGKDQIPLEPPINRRSVTKASSSIDPDMIDETNYKEKAKSIYKESSREIRDLD